MASPVLHGVFGEPPRALCTPDSAAQQFSPLVPDACALEEVQPATLESLVMLAPPGTLERRYTLALALQALKPDGLLQVAALKDKGGQRLRKELEHFGCTVSEISKMHFRVCTVQRPASLSGCEEAFEAGRMQKVAALNLWSQPGIFSWNTVDAGSALLLEHIRPLAGKGADLGCGIGHLALHILASLRVTELHLVDTDRRAVEASRQNITDPRAQFHWADARQIVLNNLDFVVMNPPFHDKGMEDRALGQAFVAKAASCLRKGGVLWLTANRHLPYEDILAKNFARVTAVEQGKGYKIYEAVK